jgi:hypothetical protein
MSLELLTMALFLWLKYTYNQAILSKLKKVYDSGLVVPPNVENWTMAFGERCTELAYSPRSGRPRGTGKADAGGALMEGNGYSS